MQLDYFFNVSKTLLFVYNADSGFLNAIKDGIEKIANPDDYGCKLCGLTYGLITMKTSWRYFLNQLPIKSIFLHRDEYVKKYDKQEPLPAVFFEESGNLVQIISSQDFEELSTLKGLETLLKQRLKEHKIL